MHNETLEQIRARVLDHGRVYNFWADDVAGYENRFGFWSPSEISEFLDKPRYADIKWRFFRNDDVAVYQSLVKDIPLSTMFNFAKNLMRPIYTGFTETSENKEFLRISGKFYFHLFIQEEIYVSYKLFKSNPKSFIKTEDPKLQPEVNEIKRHDYDIWIKSSGSEYDDDNDFIHVDTNLIVEIPDWREHLIRVRWGADYLDNFTNWLNISVIWLTLTEFLKQAAKLVGTRVQITTDNHSTAEQTKLRGMLESMQNIIYQNFNDKVDIVPLEFMTGQDLKELRDCIYHYLDRLTYEYGRVANTNPKGDRYSVGESYKDITGISNRLKETLEELISFGFQAEDKWGQYLEFSISGIPEKEALFTTAHLAQNPNSEKEYFGQVEGTVPRRPLGQRGRRMSNNRRQQNG